MGSPDVVKGRGVGFRAALLASQEEQVPSHKWKELKAHVKGEPKKKKTFMKRSYTDRVW